MPEDVKPHPVSAEDSPEWNDMTPDQKAKSARAMECFAGMVECIDHNVGKVRYNPRAKEPSCDAGPVNCR